MLKRLGNWIRTQVMRYPGGYIFALFAFAAGMAGGIYYFHYIGSSEVPTFKNCLDGYILYIARGKADRWGIFLHAWTNDLQSLFLLLLCGLHPVPAVLSPVIISGRGFVLGFTATVLIKVMAWQGVPVLLFGVLLPYLVTLPLLLYAWVLCYSRIKEKVTGPRMKGKYRISRADKGYFMRFVTCGLTAAVTAAYVALLLPLIMSGVYGFLDTFI